MSCSSDASAFYKMLLRPDEQDITPRSDTEYGVSRPLDGPDAALTGWAERRMLGWDLRMPSDVGQALRQETPERLGGSLQEHSGDWTPGANPEHTSFPMRPPGPGWNVARARTYPHVR